MTRGAAVPNLHTDDGSPRCYVTGPPEPGEADKARALLPEPAITDPQEAHAAILAALNMNTPHTSLALVRHAEGSGLPLPRDVAALPKDQAARWITELYPARLVAELAAQVEQATAAPEAAPSPAPDDAPGQAPPAVRKAHAASTRPPEPAPEVPAWLRLAADLGPLVNDQTVAIPIGRLAALVGAVDPAPDASHGYALADLLRAALDHLAARKRPTKAEQEAAAILERAITVADGLAARWAAQNSSPMLTVCDVPPAVSGGPDAD